jgi:hypothetical protein
MRRPRRDETNGQLLMAWRLQQRDVSLEEMERRMLLLATMAGRSRQQRRERKRRERRASLGERP